MRKENGDFPQEEMEKKDGAQEQQKKLSETWAQDALADLDDFIEESGVFIRQ